MELKDYLILIHPAIAVIVIFPLIGMVVYFGWQTRQRRRENTAVNKSKIPPNVGLEHANLGRVLTGAVVGVTLLGLAYPILEHIVREKTWSQAPLQVFFIVLMFMDTIACLILLYPAKKRLWRGLLATLTGAGLVIIGCQDGVFRRTDQWYLSHYYIGIVASQLMIFSLAIEPDIYQDKSARWRTIHIILNSFALLLFIGQGLTGTRDLLEMPLSWQKPYMEQLIEQHCHSNTCRIQALPQSQNNH